MSAVEKSAALIFLCINAFSDDTYFNQYGSEQLPI